MPRINGHPTMWLIQKGAEYCPPNPIKVQIQRTFNGLLLFWPKTAYTACSTDSSLQNPQKFHTPSIRTQCVTPCVPVSEIGEKIGENGRWWKPNMKGIRRGTRICLSSKIKACNVNATRLVIQKGIFHVIMIYLVFQHDELCTIDLIESWSHFCMV